MRKFRSDLQLKGFVNEIEFSGVRPVSPILANQVNLDIPLNYAFKRIKPHVTCNAISLTTYASIDPVRTDPQINSDIQATIQSKAIHLSDCQLIQKPPPIAM